MILHYVPKIKANIVIYSNKKTTNILDGTYKSVYKGRSLNFSDLREYVLGDNVKDIDWKASARSRKILIKQFVAEKNHNVLLLLDTGDKLLGDTNNGEPKKNVALMTAGTIAYLTNKNGDCFSTLYHSKDKIYFSNFKTGIANVEKVLFDFDYDKTVTQGEKDINQVFDYVNKYIKKRTILFIITDIDGLAKIDDEKIKRLSLRHDILIININDAYMSGDNVYDIQEKKYLPKIMIKNKELYNLEIKNRQQIVNNLLNKIVKYRISMVTINSTKEITMKIIDLLERHRNANIR